MANNFLQFDETDTNILTQEEYLMDSQRTNGFVSGIARSIFFNKVLKQVTTMCAAIGEVISGKGYNATEVKTDLSDAITNTIKAVALDAPVKIIGTLNAGSTSLVISNEAILITSTIDIYTDTFGANPTNVVVENGSIILTFDAKETAVGVKVEVR